MRTRAAIGRRRAGGWFRRATAARALARFHRDERGDMLEYAMVFAFIALPLMFLFDRLFEILSDYFGMIAFFVTWPFI
ncbi:MAG: hypothetical protein IMZ66_02525 [Planctomycetes bacterium]|nr:hypothetical protein [Planctomycetota bacterium]